MNLQHLAWMAGLVLFLTANPASAGDADWNKDRAAQYLDSRAKAWFDFGGSGRGSGMDKTSCISCHTSLPYALARPVLTKLAGDKEPAPLFTRILEQRKKRVDNWKDLDSPKFVLSYDFSEQKKKESWGTEAVLNALILAWEDRHQDRKEAGEATKKALANLWATQRGEGQGEGPEAGSWDWLNFGLEPWESGSARFYGATLAAIAVGTAPSYYQPGAAADVDKSVKRLQGYLQGQLKTQNLNNRIWMLWASTALDGLLDKDQRSQIAQAILDKQQDDGGWCLSSFGKYTRAGGEAQETASDGYATGLALHVLQLAGHGKDDAKIAKGLAWLRSHQEPTGEWRASSVNKKRDPQTHVGKFMTDAATAYAILALSH
jgi:squalene-hopene/tetraprenyl-beta-curcumene cyclase